MSENNLIVYENGWVINRIYEVSDRIRGTLRDQTLFEGRCIGRVGEYLSKGPERVKHKRYIERMINEVATSVIERNKNEYAELFSTLSAEQEDAEGQEIEFEPLDVLANVESEVIVKETIALLAQGDRKKSMVLQSWADGNDNITSISRTLASTFGGNTDSHRKSVNRFRTECRKKLTTAI